MDGGGHFEPDQILKDSQRTAALERMGLRVVRLCNLDVDRNLAGVCEYIDLLVEERAPSDEGAVSEAD